MAIWQKYRYTTPKETVLRYYPTNMGRKVTKTMDQKRCTTAMCSPLTFSLATKLHGGAVEFDKPVNLKEIRFVPRNDGNFIYEGDNYELYYWEKEGWTLLSNIKRYARRCTLCRQCASRYFAAPAQCHTRKRGACLYL